MGPFKAAPLAVSMKPYRQASGDGLIVLILIDELKIRGSFTSRRPQP
jgi:hypothetical protein